MPALVPRDSCPANAAGGVDGGLLFRWVVLIGYGTGATLHDRASLPLCNSHGGGLALCLKGKGSMAIKEDRTRRLDRAEQILREHKKPPRPLRLRCANHLVDALGCLERGLLASADRALDAAEKAAAETEPEPAKQPRTYTLQDLERKIHEQRASL